MPPRDPGRDRGGVVVFAVPSPREAGGHGGLHPPGARLRPLLAQLLLLRFCPRDRPGGLLRGLFFLLLSDGLQLLLLLLLLALEHPVAPRDPRNGRPVVIVPGEACGHGGVHPLRARLGLLAAPDLLLRFPDLDLVFLLRPCRVVVDVLRLRSLFRCPFRGRRRQSPLLVLLRRQVPAQAVRRGQRHGRAQHRRRRGRGVLLGIGDGQRPGNALVREDR
mmetsp:Transcript_17231/g.41361  ORF Transcript_17231/g.41361 Transcript_17231/m.41361 type:complete len:219 (+) Transcript_17231:368-1024(+)